MRKTISLLAASSILLTALPAVAQDSENAPAVSSAQKCSELEGREKIRCMKNNLRMRRHDIRAQHRARRIEFNKQQQEDFTTRRDQWRKSRQALSEECETQVREIGNGERLEFIKNCQTERRELRREQRAEQKEFLKKIRSGRRALILEERHARRTFRRNAQEQIKERQRMLLRRKDERVKYERVYDVEEEEEEEEEETETENGEE